MEQKITVNTRVKAPLATAWETYTNPIHIVCWNFASPDWHCPSAESDMRPGGIYKARMEAKDGSFGFDFEAVYKEVTVLNNFRYAFGDREAIVSFKEHEGFTDLVVQFDPESEHPPEMQQAGWQSILDNYTRYTESL